MRSRTFLQTGLAISTTHASHLLRKSGTKHGLGFSEEVVLLGGHCAIAGGVV
ncbi:MAG: hypothetical protein GY894_02560 [Planctomycetes bacterium]|nr:hypothetical protein [Planctomycetota bacterium]MCP4838231.1 hypothetical protein [Planctomycetota bacterium]